MRNTMTTSSTSMSEADIKHSRERFKTVGNRFTSRLSDNDDDKRDELIRKIEHAVENMTLAELEALSYDMFTKGYITD